MQYMLLIYDEGRQIAAMPDEERRRFMGEYFELTREIRDAGAFVAGDPLEPTTTATTVRIREGETLVTDGPFAETKEQLGGYYLLEAESIDEAIEWAAKMPSARLGSIEVRPILQLPDRDSER